MQQVHCHAALVTVVHGVAGLLANGSGNQGQEPVMIKDALETGVIQIEELKQRGNGVIVVGVVVMVMVMVAVSFQKLKS